MAMICRLSCGLALVPVLRGSRQYELSSSWSDAAHGSKSWVPADDRAWRHSHKRRRCESSADSVPFTMQQRIGKMDWSSYYCAPQMDQMVPVAV